VLGREPLMAEAPAEAVPARTVDLAGLPPTWIGVGTLDLFAQESMHFASRLIDAGVAVEMSVVPGAYHGFDTMVPQARVSADFIASWKSALGRSLETD
uniref:alpha/beta hydrolase n=1 Tax=Ensifer sp. ZNC0028 TaxID=1339236 RepID=UPI0012DFFC33